VKVQPRLEILHLDLDTIDMPIFYSGMDCLVQPSHIEGWGYSVLEAMSMEIPVIITAYGGFTDIGQFENLVNETEIDNSTVEGAFDGGWGIRVTGTTNVYDDLQSTNEDKGQWAIPDIKHLKQLMRYVFTHQEEGKRRGRVGRRKVVQKYSQEAAASIYLQEIQKHQRS